MIHSLVSGNNHLELEDGPLKEFLDQAGDMAPAERGELLVTNEDLAGIYNEAGSDQTLHHIICFVRVGDQVIWSTNHKRFNSIFLLKVYEMDCMGEKPYWIGECEDDSFGEVAMTAARGYLERNPECQEFNILAVMET